MKKKLISLFLVLFFVMTQMSTLVYAHYDTAYWHDQSSSGDNRKWMESLSGQLKLSEISIPGTHDSMSHKDNLSFIDNTRTQSMTLRQQLDSGIRFIDIRAKYTSSGFPLHHGVVYLGYDFEDVLRELRSFLSENQSETILMRFKQEYSSASDADMRRVFLTYYNRYKDIFYKGGSSNPTLEECRGKVVLLSDVYSLNDLGINYRNVKKQDDYNLNTNWDLYNKWSKIKSYAWDLNSSVNRDKLSINYLSGSGGSMPYFVASGHSNPSTGGPRLATGLTEPGFHNYYPDFPRVNWFGVFATIAFEGTNTLYANYITNQDISYTGIVAADFPGQRLIEQIISKNSIGYEGKYIIKLKNTNAVIDRNNLTSNSVTLWSRNDGQNQKWVIKYDKEKEAYQIHDAENLNNVLGLNIAVSGNYLLSSSNSKNTYQYWNIESNGKYVVFRNLIDTDMALAAYKGSHDGANLFVEKYINPDQQSFELIKIN